MKEGQAAFARKDYPTAVARADVALEIKKGDSAATKLKAEAYQGMDLAITQTFFDQGEYAKALGLCKKRAGIEAFNMLAKSIGIEQSAFDETTNKFSQGDYSFIEQLRSQSYNGKKPFADLVANAMRENVVLEELKALQRATNWPAVKARLANVAFQKKPPFTALAAWAETQRQIAPKQSLEKLDAELETYLVRFKILSPTDPKIRTAQARSEKPITLAIGFPQVEYYLARVASLERDFKENGWLDQTRRQYLTQLKKKIPNWE
jgi:hypothetical protein